LSVNFCTTSDCSLHAVHVYWYVGTGPPSGDAGTHAIRLLNIPAASSSGAG
jgi:hypothetical protein